MPGRGERALVTGGSGFVGACLARDLLAAGHKVHLILRAEAREWRLTDILPHCIVHRADLRDAGAVRTAVEAARPDVVYHLATHGAYPHQRDTGTILGTNLLGTANLLAAVDWSSCRAFVNAGSSSEYGHKASPMAETDVPEPRTDYGVTKAAATLLCQAEFFRGRPVTTVRIFSAYGPWEEPGRLVPYVMDCCGRGVTPRVTAGAQPRDFVYVRDVVDLFRLAAADPVRCGPIVHAGTGRQSTVREMIETIIDVCGNGVKVEFGAEPPRPDEPKCWVASVEGTRARTGWAPRHDLRAGVRAMWEWYQNTAPAARAA